MIELVLAAALIAPGVAAAPSPDVFAVYAYRTDSSEYRVDPELLRPADTAVDSSDWQLDLAYPVAAKRARSQGEVEVEIQVAADDKVIGCAVTKPAADVRLNAAACPTLIKQRFRHALARDGSARAGTVRMTLVFTILSGEAVVYVPPSAAPGAPRRNPEPVDEAMLTVTGASAALFPKRNPYVIVDIDADGRVTLCGIVTSAGTDKGDMRLCEVMSAVRFTPGLDRAGRPAAVKAWILAPKLKL